MTLNGTRFGQIDFTAEDILVFPEGLIGFPQLNRFVLISIKPDSPFRWLQSLDSPETAFLLAVAEHFVPSYSPVIPDYQARELEMTEETPKLLFTTASIPKGKPEDMTLNLAGPLIVNALTRKGKQVVLEDEAYTMKHRVFEQGNRESDSIAA